MTYGQMRHCAHYQMRRLTPLPERFVIYSSCIVNDNDIPDGIYAPVYESNRRNTMLGWALTFLIIALLAGLLGFVAIAGIAATIAKVLFVVFLVLFVASLLFGRRAPV